MFYLKYRPQKIYEIDNEEVRLKLTNILKSKRVPHAMLLTGPKGTGKTSAARIVAKVINCEKNLYSGKNTKFEPCNTCDNCRSITSGSSVDVFEMDAASTRKIDDIRSLIDNVKFSSTHSRYKVYIIDEVHMLTTESFNALLKTLEEPPKSTIFILATTESEKLPKTIQSRCIRFDFNKAKIDEIVRMLNRICDSEKLKIDETLLKLIAQYSDHSFRDAAKIIEEVSIQNARSEGEIKNILGLRDTDSQILKAIAEKDLKKTFEFIEAYDKKNGSFRALIEFMLDALHLSLLKKSGIDVELPKDYNFTYREITTLIRLLQEAYNLLKISPIESLPLEIAVSEYIDKVKEK